VVGPALGGYLVGLYNFKMMLLVAAVFYFIAAGLRIWMARTMRSDTEKGPLSLSTANFKLSIKTLVTMLLAGGIITWILVVDGISDISFRLSEGLSSLYLDKVGGISIEQIGLMGSFNAIAGMFVPLFSGRMVDRYGERIPLISGFLMIFVAFMVFLQAQSFAVFVLSWVIFGFGGGMLGPAYQSMISKVVPAKMLGTFSGVFYSSLGFISLPAPWLGAQIWERFSPQTPFIMTAFLSLTILPLIWFKFKLPNKGPDSPGPLESVPILEAKAEI
jgi:MFS transporter, DHA1 family, multidrug resistance protein